MKRHAHKKYFLFLSYLLIGLGLLAFCYGSYLLWLRYKPVSFDELQNVVQFSDGSGGSASDSAHLNAVQLHIPERDVHLPLIAGYVGEHGDWKLSDDAGLVIRSGKSEQASESGTIVYGHNYPRILGGLSKVQIGDEVELVMSDWGKQQFVVVDVTVVEPADVQSVIIGGADELVVYTCTGFLDSKRLVVRAERI